MKAAQAVTLFDGYDYVRPEAILELAVPVIAHRMVLEPQARFSGQTTRGIVEQIIHNVPVPA
jgi:MoxR-like ATPase